MQRLIAGFVALVAFAVSADHSVGPQTWNLYRGTRIVARDFPTLEACARAADESNEVRAFGCQSNRVQVSVTADAPPPPPPPVAPSPPTNVADNGTVLSWTPPTQDVNGNPLTNVVHTIQQRFNGGAYTSIVTELAASTYPITGLAPGTYCWRVYAKWVGGSSDPSNVWCKTIAAPPPPPPPPTGGAYTIDTALLNARCTVERPIPPRITRDINVTPSTLAANIRTPGVRLVFGSGDYSGAHFTASDQLIFLKNGANLNTVEVGASAQRLAFDSENPRQGRAQRFWLYPGATDIQILGVTIDATGTGNTGLYGLNLQGANRVLVMGAHITAPAYAVYAPDVRNAVIANTYMRSATNQSGVRFWAGQLVAVDNYLRVDHGGLTWRLHTSNNLATDCNDIRRNVISGSGSAVIAPSGNPADRPLAMGTVYWENDHYCSGCSMIVGDSNDHAARIEMRSRFFGGREPPKVVSSWVYENQVLPARSAPAWNFR